MSEERNKAAIRASFDAWSSAAGSPYDLLADDARWTLEGNSVVAKTYAGREEFLREVIRPFNARLKSPLRPVIRNLYAEGDTVIAFFDACGIAKDGRTYANTYAWFLEMRDGKIFRASAFFDSIEFNAIWSRIEPADFPTS